MQSSSAVGAFFRRELRGKLRVWLSWIMLPLILFNIVQYPTALGLAVLVAGAFLRVWASGLLRKEGQLCTGGPYSFSRNPLYLGSILLGLALPISQNNWWLTAVILVANGLMFYPLIAAEEAVLAPKFGGVYQLYTETVGRFFSPLRFLAFLVGKTDAAAADSVTFNWPLWKKNKGWEAIFVAIGLAGVTYGIAYLRLRNSY